MLKKSLFCAIGLALLVSFGTNDPEVKAEPTLSSGSGTEVCWAQEFDTKEELRSASDLVITGTVVREETELRHDVVFTKGYVRIDKSEKGGVAVGAVIPVLQTGGTYGDITTSEITGVPMLQIGEKYELYLTEAEYTEQYGSYYLIAGGFQGALKIENGKKIAICEENKLFENEKNVVATKANTPVFSYYWKKSTLSVYVDGSIRDRYSSVTRGGICAGINAWAANTDSPKTTITTSSGFADVMVNMNDYGATNWDAITETFYNNNNNVCYNSVMKIIAHYRTQYYSTRGLWQAIACHKFGHTLGLKHNNSSSPSIMKEYTQDYYNLNGSPKWTVPKSADIIPINLKY